MFRFKYIFAFFKGNITICFAFFKGNVMISFAFSQSKAGNWWSFDCHLASPSFIVIFAARFASRSFLRPTKL